MGPRDSLNDVDLEKGPDVNPLPLSRREDAYHERRPDVLATIDEKKARQEDISVPLNLLTVGAGHRTEWTPDPQPRLSIEGHADSGDFDESRQQQRASTLSALEGGNSEVADHAHAPRASRTPAAGRFSEDVDSKTRPSWRRSQTSTNSARHPRTWSNPETPRLASRAGDYQSEKQEAQPSGDDDALTSVLNRFGFAGPRSGTRPEATEDNAEVDPFADPPSNPFSDEYNSRGPIVRVATKRSERRRTLSNASQAVRKRSASIAHTTADLAAVARQKVADGIEDAARKASVYDLYTNAKERGAKLQRSKAYQVIFEYTVYALILLFAYFVLAGRPLWNGAVWWLYYAVSEYFTVAGTWSITIGMAIIYAYVPLSIFFEKEPPMPAENHILDPLKNGSHNTALLIPCYKAARLIGPTLEAALKIFPASHIYVIANGNSPTPLDDTEDVCRNYKVNHIWSPVGSKIVAQFVGCYAVKRFENVLLIDDDCALPANFPIVSDRMTDMVKCIGYTIKSVGPESSAGNLCQQAQDLEYKLSGLQRAFAGKIGSATFPHGAISLWNTEFLIKTFHTHPGFSVSEDWFFGHVARELGSRIQMCTSIFVETETPGAVFFSSGGARGGFGEMTIFKQRFYRWNFFFVNGMYYNMKYILCSWKLGWWELGAKIFVFQEVYETLLYMLAPFVLPISFVVRPSFAGYLFLATFALYTINVIIFNEVHLRRRNERVGFVATYIYYTFYKAALSAVNVFSCYYSLFKYARYFAKRHPKIVEDEKAVEVVMKLEENTPASSDTSSDRGRRLTLTAVGTRIPSANERITFDESRTRKSSEALGRRPTLISVAGRTSSRGEGRHSYISQGSESRQHTSWYSEKVADDTRGPEVRFDATIKRTTSGGSIERVPTRRASARRSTGDRNSMPRLSLLRQNTDELDLTGSRTEESRGPGESTGNSSSGVPQSTPFTSATVDQSPFADVHGVEDDVVRRPSTYQHLDPVVESADEPADDAHRLEAGHGNARQSWRT